MKIERVAEKKDWICKDRVHSNLIRLAFVRYLLFRNCLLIFESTLLSVMSCIVHLFISVFYSTDFPSIHVWLKRCWYDDGKVSWKLDSMFGHVIGSFSFAAPAGINRNSVHSHRSSLYHIALTAHRLSHLVLSIYFIMLSPVTKPEKRINPLQWLLPSFDIFISQYLPTSRHEICFIFDLKCFY